MMSAPDSSMVDRPQLGSLAKSAVLLSWVLAGAMFLSVGWMAMAPDDPLGAVSLLARRPAAEMFLLSLLLACATAAVASAIAGRWAADVGSFTAALGFMAVSLRGGTAQHLLTYRGRASGSMEILPLWLMVESVAWFIILLATLLVSAVTMRWLRGLFGPAPPATVPDLPQWLPTAADLPHLGSHLTGNASDACTDPRGGLRHLIVFTGIALITIAALSSGGSNRGVEHGQVCFVLAAATCLAAVVAHRYTPVRSSFWTLVGVLAVALLGLLWSWGRLLLMKEAALTPPGAFLRILPIQYIAVGAASALAMQWYILPPLPVQAKGKREAERPSPQPGR